MKAPLALAAAVTLLAGCSGSGDTATPSVRPTSTSQPSAGSDNWVKSSDGLVKPSCTVVNGLWVVRATVKNPGKEKAEFALVAEALDKNKKSVAQFRWRGSLAAGASHAIKDSSFGKGEEGGSCGMSLLTRPAP